MKRSDVVKLISNWAKEEILKDMYANNYQEWADNLLYVLESEIGVLPPLKVKSGVFTENTGEVILNKKVNEWDKE